LTDQSAVKPKTKPDRRTHPSACSLSSMIVRNFDRNLAGMQIVPAALVGAARSSLRAQGFDPDLIKPNGEIDPAGLITSAFETVEIRSALTPPMVIKLRGPSNPNTQKLIDEVQPMLVLQGKAGRYQFAPSGVPTTLNMSSIGTTLGFGIGAALLGLLFVGAAVFRR
jgi:hypothetical protein